MSLLKIQGFVSALCAKPEYRVILSEIVDEFSTSNPVYNLEFPNYGDGVECLISSSLLGLISSDDTIMLRDYFVSEEAHYLAVAYLISFAYQDKLTETSLSDLSKLMLGFSDDFDQALRRVGHVIGWGSISRALNHIHTSNQQQNDVLIALYYLMQFPDNFSDMTDELSSQSVLLLNLISNMLNKTQVTNSQAIQLTEKLQAMKANL